MLPMPITKVERPVHINRAYFGDGFFGLLRLRDVIYRHTAPGARELQRDPPADPTTGSRHECDAPTQHFIHVYAHA